MGHLLALVVVLLAGCATQTRFTEVKVPVPVPCVRADQVPDFPELKDDDDILHMDRRRRTFTVWDERAVLKIYATEMQALVNACLSGER